MLKKNLKLLSLVLVGLTLVFGSLLVTAAEQATRGGTLVYIIEKDIQRIDPLTTAWMTDGGMMLYDRLVSIDYDGNFRDGLAESWAFSEDGMTLTFNLKKGVRFHDGTPFNSESVSWFYEKTKAPGFIWAWHYAGIESCETPDEYTVVFKLKHPSPLILFALSTMYAGIPSPTAYEAFGEDYGVKAVVGTGPFKFVSWTPGELVLERNDEYSWGPSWLPNSGPPYLDGIIYRFLPEAATRALELEAGTAHIVSVMPVAEANRLVGDPYITQMKIPRWMVLHLSFNTEQWPFDDLQVRRALSHAFNTEAMRRVAYLGEAVATYDFVPVDMQGYQPVMEESAKYDLALAKSMLADAGWEDTDGDGIIDKDGVPFITDILATTETEFGQIAVMAQAQLGKLGIKASITILDKPTRDTWVRQNKASIMVDYYVWNDIEIVEFFFHSKNMPFPNQSRIDDPYVDGLLEEARTVPTTNDERIQTYQAVIRYLAGLAVWVPVAVPLDIWAVRSEVRDLELNVWHSGSQYPYMNIVWLEE